MQTSSASGPASGPCSAIETSWLNPHPCARRRPARFPRGRAGSRRRRIQPPRPEPATAAPGPPRPRAQPRPHGAAAPRHGSRRGRRPRRERLARLSQRDLGRQARPLVPRRRAGSTRSGRTWTPADAAGPILTPLARPCRRAFSRASSTAAGQLSVAVTAAPGSSSAIASAIAPDPVPTSSTRSAADLARPRQAARSRDAGSERDGPRRAPARGNWCP